MTDLFYTTHVIMSVYSILLAAFGTIGNFISAIVCTRKRLRTTPTFVFLGFMSVIDACGLYFWNFNDFFITFFGYTMGDISEDTCKLTLFCQTVTLQTSSYLLVCVSIERLLSVKIKHWKTKHFKAKHAFFICIGVFGVFFILNSHVLFTVTFPERNSTTIGSCSATPTSRFWRPIHSYIYSMAPFGILTVINAMLIKHVIKSKNQINATISQKNDKQLGMTVSVIAMTVSFIALTGPFAITTGYFSSYLFHDENGRILLYLTYSIAFTFHGSNFLVLSTSNKQFKRELKILWREIKSGNKIGIIQTSTELRVDATTNKKKTKSILEHK